MKQMRDKNLIRKLADEVSKANDESIVWTDITPSLDTSIVEGGYLKLAKKNGMILLQGRFVTAESVTVGQNLISLSNALIAVKESLFLSVPSLEGTALMPVTLLVYRHDHPTNLDNIVFRTDLESGSTIFIDCAWPA